MGPLTKVPCVRCLDNTSTPSAFLLTCKNCNKTWHHRCHQPPVQDSELIARIKAFNSGDFENGIAGWRCRRCMKGKGRAVLSQQPSTPSNPVVVDSVVEQPPKPLRGQTQAKSTRAKSTRSKSTLQPTTSYNPDPQSTPTAHRDAQPSGSMDLRNGLEPPLVQRNTAPTLEVVDLTMSSDEETVQPPINEPKRPHYTRSQSKAQDQSRLPTRPAPPAPDPSVHRIRSTPSPQPDTPIHQAVPVARPISPDPPMPPPPHHPVEPGPPAQPEPANDTEPTPEPEPEPEAIPIGPVMTPWQTYNLAPCWIRARHEDKGAPNPWEESLVKQMASTRISATKRKPAARHLSSDGGREAPFNFSSRVWLRTRDNKISARIS